MAGGVFSAVDVAGIVSGGVPVTDFWEGLVSLWSAFRHHPNPRSIFKLPSPSPLRGRRSTPGFQPTMTNPLSGIGISSFNVSNSCGLSTSASGLNAVNVSNCEGVSTSGAAGISASSGTVSFIRGKRDGGVAINTTNAIGCTVSGTGTVTATNKSLGTP